MKRNFHIFTPETLFNIILGAGDFLREHILGGNGHPLPSPHSFIHFN